MTFKDKLMNLIDDPKGRFGKSRNVTEYNRMIRYGAFGELSENYYLYIYRDIYRNSAYYGAVVFINKRDERGNPVRVIGFEQDGAEQLRNIYVRAALYFLENEYQNTMSIAGKISMIFNMAKEKINTYIDQMPAITKELEEFDFNVKNQTIAFEKIDLKVNERQLENHNLMKQLGILEKKTSRRTDDAVESSRTNALPGLNLKIDFAALTGEKRVNFQPLAIPVSDSGKLGSPKKLKPGDYAKYQFQEISPLLEEVFTRSDSLVPPDYNDSLRTKTINRMFFRQMVDEFFLMPPDLRFCQCPDLAKAFNPLETLTFNKIQVSFAPVLKKETVFRIRLNLTAVPSDAGTATDGIDDGIEAIEVDAGDDYTVKISGDMVYLFFISPDGGNYFAVPQDPAPFLTFFKFLAAGNEFFTCDFGELVKVVKRLESESISIDSDLLEIYRFKLKPVPVLEIHPANPVVDKCSHLEVVFDYMSAIRVFLKKHPEKRLFTYDNDAEFENMCFNLLRTDSRLKQDMVYDEERQVVSYLFYFKDIEYIDWIVEKGMSYMEKGFRVYLVKWKKYLDNTGSQLRISLDTDIDWLAFRPTVHFGDQGEDSGVPVDSILPDTNMVVDKKGKLHLLTKEEIEKLAALFRYGHRQGDALQVPSRNHIIINRLYDKRMAHMPRLKETIAAGKKLETFETIDDYPVSTNFNGQLRNYQKEGFKWLRFLHDYDFSGCLADDMGLGKTVQTLALLQTLKDEAKLKTSLLVVPVSAIPNWEMEIEKFAPGLSCHRHIGPKREKTTKKWKNRDLLITSYATMRIDVELFSKFQFDYIILDESQNIKNYTSQVSRAAKVLKGNHRLGLSGTPIENTSMDLWSLFDFLMPRYLGNHQWFSRHFVNAVEKEKDDDYMNLLKTMIYPFMLRRKKAEVETELPEKTEIVTKVRMEEEQLKLYADMSAAFREELETALEEGAESKSSMLIFEKMLRLRQLCLFPRLVDESYRDIPSAKFGHFTGLLEDILAEDHKVLVFSQFVEVLKLLRGHCDDQGVNYAYLDGSTKVKTREEMIRRFQEDEDCRVFLLSLKAGGVALNLTAADYVIIFDPWWNPAVEAQAVDRSHRIGQTRKVLVYRMVVEGSIEEKILQLQAAKQELVENIITSDVKAFKDLKKTDILKLFGS